MTKAEMMTVLTPESPEWEAFVKILFDAMERDGCDGDAGQAVHRHARAAMTSMGGIDIEETLAFFESRGGYCDCEILLNVDRDWGWMRYAEQGQQ
jgi:hypothetical protein